MEKLIIDGCGTPNAWWDGNGDGAGDYCMESGDGWGQGSSNTDGRGYHPLHRDGVGYGDMSFTHGNGWGSSDDHDTPSEW
jgi:hypothetical protein